MREFHCNLHMIGNQCAQYESICFKSKEEYALRVADRFPVNVTLNFDSKVISVICTIRCY